MSVLDENSKEIQVEMRRKYNIIYSKRSWNNISNEKSKETKHERIINLMKKITKLTKKELCR